MLESRVWILLLTSLLSSALANIPVRYKVTLSCNESSPHYTGCLRGMTCEDGEKCTKPAIRVYADSLYFLEADDLSRRQAEPPAAAPSTEPKLGPAPAAAGGGGPVTTDGTCGAGNGDTVCGDWPQGGCCSLYGVSRPTSHSGRCFVLMSPVLRQDNSSLRRRLPIWSLRGCSCGSCAWTIPSP